MHNILTIAKREITRLRTRFRGRSRTIIIAAVILAGVMSYLVSQQGLVLSRGFYAVGITPDGPVVLDGRFRVAIVDRHSGPDLLREGRIDVYLNGDEVVWRKDRRSRRAAGALKQVLEKQELVRIANEYDLDRAFPLRVMVHRAPLPGDSDTLATSVALWDMMRTAETAPETRAEALESAPTNRGSATSTAVLLQLDRFQNDNKLPEFKAEFVSDEEIIIPSLMDPPMPLAQVLIAFFYVVPMFFVSIFFTSSFMEEKVDRKLVILLSTPVTPFQIIVGKMLPYIGYSIISIIAITLVLQGNIWLALAVFIPVTLFIFSVYLMVALLYRTFKDQTFFSLLAVTVITAYLIFPSMFSGISELSHISPLSLAVEMYKGETFAPAEYFLATTPMFLVFGLSMFVGVRIFNEEYLMGFRPLHKKLSEAISLTMDRRRPHLSVFLLGLLVIPVVFMVQLTAIAVAFNLPTTIALIALLLMSVVVEEVAKSAGIVVLLQQKLTPSLSKIVTLSAVAALGFFIGEKLLLYIALKVISESLFTEAVFGAGLLLMPLFAHFTFTFIVCLMTARLGIRRYPIAIIAGSVIHAVYNLVVLGVIP